MLITAAPRRTARAIWRAESEQEIRRGSGRLSARAPGHTPTKPTPFCGAAATVAVAVPWKSATERPPVEAVPEPKTSGWAGSSGESTSAISGLAASTGGATAPATTTSRQPACGTTESGSAGACARARGRSGSAKASRPRAWRARASTRARVRGTRYADAVMRRAPCARAIAWAGRRAATIQARGEAAAAAVRSAGSTTARGTARVRSPADAGAATARAARTASAAAGIRAVTASRVRVRGRGPRFTP
jgi:hypothetical protein